MTPVIYRYWKGEVIALFPTIPGNNDAQHCQSYQRIGQHGAAHYKGIIADSRPATLSERAKLHLELVRIGYDDLKVFKRTHSVFHARLLKQLRR